MNDAKCHTKDSLTKGVTAPAYITQSARWPCSKATLPVLRRQPAEMYLSRFFVVETRTGVRLNEKQIDHLKDALRKKDFKHVTPEQVTQNRRDFDAVKDELIAEWERLTGQSWPRYAENVPKKNGKPGFSRLKGDPYDAHHLIENELDGPAEWWNIHPARFPDQHQGGIHGSGSPLRKLLENID